MSVLKEDFLKSPLNYIGGKYKMLPQLYKFFPKSIHTFVDLFAGGLDVAINITANEIYCNDINHYVIGIYEAFLKYTIDELLDYIDSTISSRQLSMTNKEAYLAFRDEYNRTKNPLDLYILVCYSFNYQFRFNSRHEYNNPFGRDRSSFNPNMRKNLIRFHEKIKNMNFQSMNFKNYPIDGLGAGDFVYADPPYLITCGAYNDGKRGFEGWSKDDDAALFEMLDRLDAGGVKFALSNVSEHKGVKNEPLISWKRKYHTHKINYNYNNSNYQSTSKNSITKEILVTNY